MGSLAPAVFGVQVNEVHSVTRKTRQPALEYIPKGDADSKVSQDRDRDGIACEGRLFRSIDRSVDPVTPSVC